VQRTLVKVAGVLAAAALGVAAGSVIPQAGAAQRAGGQRLDVRDAQTLALRRQLPAHVALWAGGEMTRRVRKTLSGVVFIADLAAAQNALKMWRSHASVQAT